jgi:transposase
MNKTRRHFSGPEKVAILKRHLLEKTPVSDLCDELRIGPNLFYRWQKEFFENGHAAFQPHWRGGDGTARHPQKPGGSTRSHTVTDRAAAGP